MNLDRHLVATALASALVTTGIHAQTTPDSVNTRIGAMKFERGYPTEETARKLFDELDYQRAVQAYLWAYPAVSFESIRLALKQDFGADHHDMVIADNFLDAKSLWLTANDTTIYAVTNVDLGKAGPVVVEVPPGAIVGLIDDFWQRSATDVGLPGPHGDKGGKFLLVPPGYKGELPKEGYEVRRATMNNYNVMVRGIFTDLDKDVPNAVETVKKMRVYPLSERNPKPNKFTSMSGKAMNTLPPTGLEYWARLSAFINNNPVQERDRFFMAMLKPLGIEKGQAVQSRRAAARHPRRRCPHRRCNGSHDAVRFRAAVQRRQRHGRHQLELGAARESQRRRPPATANSTSGCTTPTVRSTRRPASAS